MCLAIPGRLESIDGDDPVLASGRVRFGGVLREVSLACVPEAKPGDWVLVHVGMAISVVDEEEAQTVFRYLEEMGELGELQDLGSGGPAEEPPA